jgi:murein L,D-transpeptidase YafK
VVTLLAVAGSVFQIGRALATLVVLVAAGLALAEPPTDETAAPSPATPLAAPAALAPPAALGPETGEVMAVRTRKRELWLCIDGAPAARFEVALGQGGLDKRQKGDRRTPLGTYELGTPRLSGRFGIFIPIVYPTREQAAQGLTGGDVGIHGPPRKLPEPEYPTTAFDWTLGCVATGTDADIALIANFVRERKPMLVVR